MNLVENMRELVNAVSTHVQSIDPELEVKFGTDFCYIGSRNLIVFTLEMTRRSFLSFSAFVEENFPDIQADIFLWSLYHEVGHNATEDDFDQDDWTEYLDTINHWTDSRNDSDYYSLPIEYAATEWAAEYMMKHADEVRVFWNQIQPIILDMYKEIE